MDIEEKITKVKEKAARVAIKLATVATVVTGAGALTSCQENDRNIDKNKDKIENIKGEKTSVVFRSNHVHTAYTDITDIILFEDGTSIKCLDDDKAHFLQPGDTVTYKNDKLSRSSAIKAVRYKDGSGKKVNFGNIGKVGKDITD